VQAPQFSQSYNRYMYVMGNPVGATDPTGYRTSQQDLYAWTQEMQYNERLGNQRAGDANASFAEGTRMTEDTYAKGRGDMSSKFENAKMYTQSGGEFGVSLSGKRGSGEAPNEEPGANVGQVGGSNNASSSKDKNGVVAQKETVSIKSAGGGTLTINIYGDGSMNIKGAAERTKSTLIAAGAGKGNTKENREYTVLVAADKDAALGMAREVELDVSQKRFVGGSRAWKESESGVSGQAQPDIGIAVVNTSRTNEGYGIRADFALSVETAHEVGHLLMPGNSPSRDHHGTLGIMQAMPAAMGSPHFTKEGIEMMKQGKAGGFFR